MGHLSRNAALAVSLVLVLAEGRAGAPVGPPRARLHAGAGQRHRAAPRLVLRGGGKGRPREGSGDSRRDRGREDAPGVYSVGGVPRGRVAACLCWCLCLCLSCRCAPVSVRETPGPRGRVAAWPRGRVLVLVLVLALVLRVRPRFCEARSGPVRRALRGSHAPVPAPRGAGKFGGAARRPC